MILTVKDMVRICKFSMKSYKKGKQMPYHAIEIVPVNEYIRIYFTNGVTAAKLEIPKTSINVACECAFMPDTFIEHLEACDKATVSYLRDIEPVERIYELNCCWFTQFESLMKTNPRRSNTVAKIEYNVRLICDVSNLIKQLGFERINMSFVADRVGFMSAFEGRSFIEFIIMPVVR